ncbi:DUF2490 domain-containing protein [Rufibacter hautae]|uniref:DUF2490 domain-containing protein n=1 Tax=Rufibacter hautae TaxID=2595005 RepID=A0A5B6TTG9_9BACT|nr:DUF2490 domain-containing protein [Rufibacter hautae]KAA3439818.1 DUF2490 domain-containing protein [Rufibacter hautae]
MKQTLRFTLTLLLIFPFQSQAQTAEKKVTDRSQVWLGYFNQTRLSDKFSLWLDLHARRTDFLDRWATTIVRPGITYHISDHTRFTVGYAYASHWPISETDETVRPEHRLWQQINWSGKSKRLQTNQWVRLEERFNRNIANDQLQEGYHFNFRARYMIGLMVPLTADAIAPGVPFLVFNDEVHVNFGKEIVYNYFDQNRLFGGVGYQFSKSFNAQLGYMNVFQQTAAGNQFFNTHTLRLFLFHTLDLRKPKAEPVAN